VRVRLRRAPEDAPPAPPDEAPQPRAVRRALPPASQLRRERRSLLQVRERRLRDLGGLMVEMYRRDQFRQDLIVDRCLELARIDERLAELETLLTVAASRGRVREAARCECGAPLFWGAKFCGQCGRAVAAT
jgi:uncharacterized protein YjiS (DUF1127 family)